MNARRIARTSLLSGFVLCLSAFAQQANGSKEFRHHAFPSTAVSGITLGGMNQDIGVTVQVRPT